MKLNIRKRKISFLTTPREKMIFFSALAVIALFVILFIVQTARLASVKKKLKTVSATALEGQSQNEGKQPEAGKASPEPTKVPTPTSLPTPSPTPTPYPYVVCIDAGHGDWDGGAALVQNGVEVQIEKSDNLRMALLFRDALSEYPVQTVMTREDDTYLELEERTAIANQANADFFISFHRNSYDASSEAEAQNVKGVEFWLHNSKPEEVILLAERMMAALIKCGISRDRGVKFGSMSDSKRNYAINQYSSMPSMILELGFVTNTEDNKNINEKGEAYAKELAKVVYEWLVDQEKEKPVITE